MSCHTCQRHRARIAGAKSDLRTAARKAVRWPTDRNIAEIEERKKQLAQIKEVAAQHEAECTEIVSA